MQVPQSTIDQSKVFVGRTRELSELGRELGNLAAGHGGLCLLAGEAGIGKTRLADEVAASARASGAEVVWGRCWESGGAPAYWPWTQVLRACLRHNLAADDRYLSRAAFSDLAEIVPELTGRTDPSDPPAARPVSSAIPEDGRFRLFDAVANLLRSWVEHRPLVLIFDDLHTADQPSLLLLRFVARELRELPALLIGTYRDREAFQNPVTGQLIAELVRDGKRFPLQRLSRDEVVTFVTQLGGVASSAPMIDAVFAATEGHPLFVSETLRLLASDQQREGALSTSVPEELRDVIRRRIESLSPTTREFLTLAAVAGREFEATLVTRAAEIGPAEALASLDEACAARIVAPLAGTVGRYSFSHVLLRDTLHEDLSATRRAELHRRVGEGLEQSLLTGRHDLLAETAHHFFQAAIDGDVEKAILYEGRTGDRAVAQLAYEEGVQHYERALQALDLKRGPSRPENLVTRCQLLLALGEAQWSSGGLSVMRETFHKAAEVAKVLIGQPEAPEAPRFLALAALGFGGKQQRAHLVYDPLVISLLEDALVALGHGDEDLRARLLARLAYALYTEPGSFARRAALCQEAIELARKRSDPATLRWVLNDWRWALWSPGTIEERLRIGTELVGLMKRKHDREALLGEHTWRFVDMLELGDMVAVEAELEAYTATALDMRRSWHLWYVGRFGATLAILQGRFEDAERLAADALEHAQRVQQQDAFLVYGTQVLTLRAWQGRLEELEAGVQSFVAQYPALPIWRYVVGFMQAELGREADARRELDRVASQDFKDIADDYMRLPALAYLSVVCSFVGDGVRAQLLYELMLPYADRFVVVGFGVACLGSVARYLGNLAATMGKWEVAEAHFEAALEANQRMKSLPAIAQTKFDQGRTALEAAASGTILPITAAEALTAASELATRLGMVSLRQRIADVQGRVPPPVLVTTAPKRGGEETRESRSASARVMFRQNGEYWMIGRGEGVIRLRHLLGFVYVSQLLANPGQAFHAADLAARFAENPSGDRGVASDPNAANVRADLGDAGPVFDRQARDAYRGRLNDLREELAEAEANCDLGRVDLLREEMEAISDQLTAGVGLAGRERKVAAHTDRVRVAVTKAIRIALRRISEHDPSLGRSLSNSIKTGSLCSYEPDPNLHLAWDF